MPKTLPPLPPRRRTMAQRIDKAKRNADGAIVDAINLTCDHVVGQRVLCPLGDDKVFERWPLGWDRHAEFCGGVDGTPEERKREYKQRLRHLFR